MVQFENLVEELSKSKKYGDNVKEVKVIPTAISTVFLTGKYVYKILKHEKRNFFDFSTFEKRKESCKKIIEKNKPISPEIYVGVVPITLDNGEITIDGDGEVIEYAVKMKELPQEEIMSSVLKKGGVTEKHIKKLADEVVRFHKSAKVNEETKRNASLENVLYQCNNNFKETEEYVGKLISPYDFYAIKYSVFSFIAENKELFKKRVEEGFGKDCHGDLHTGNIFIHKNKPLIFDAIDFNDKLSQLDTAADVAFMLMDLEFSGRKDFSKLFLDEYLKGTRDTEMLELLPFYKCYRAYVRAKVNSIISSSVPEDRKLSFENLAKEYYNLAKNYSNQLSLNPTVFIFTGLQGTGKSFCAKSLEKVLGCPRILTDKVRREIYNLPVEGEIPEEKKAEVFSKEGIDKGYAAMFRVAEKYLSNGESCILDATFDSKEKRKKIYSLASNLGADSVLVYCTAPDNICIERTSKKRRFSVAGPETFKKYKLSFECPSSDENPVEIDCSTSGENIPALMEPILNYKVRGVLK